MSVLTIERLAGTVGAEVVDADPEQMASDDAYVTAILDVLEANGVLVFRRIDLDPEHQIGFCRRVGEIDTSYEGGLTDIPGVIKISLDPTVNSRAEILKATFDWHIDGCIPMNDECPQMATVLTAAVVAEHGGETEFANTYAGYDALSDDEKARFASHARRALVGGVAAAPPSRSVRGAPCEVAQPSAVDAPARLDPPIGPQVAGPGQHGQPHRGHGRGRGTCVAPRPARGTTVPENVYRHHWSVGDTVMWDNRGVLHRVTPYTAESRREMLRTTILGDEPIQ